MTDELEILRLRQADHIDAALDPPDGGASTVGLVVQTVTVTTYPTSAGVYYGVQALDPTGTETEGGSGTLANAGGTFYALNIGPNIPAVTTYHIVRFIGGRWTFRY